MPNQPNDNSGRRVVLPHAEGELNRAPAGRLSSQGFAYDPAGNRVSSVDVGGVPPAQSNVVGAPRITDYTANALNQYTQAGGVTFAYDVKGNLIDDGKQHYAYDAQNRLISVESVPVGGAAPVRHSSQSDGGRPDSVRAEFFYDARNRCVLRKFYTVGSQGQWVLSTADSRALTYDTRWNLLAERTLTGAQSGKYVHGIRVDEILQWTGSDGAKLCPLADGLGSTVALSDHQARVTERYRYDAFGTPHVLSAGYSPLSTGSAYRFLFTGREWLGSISLNEHRNRYYSPGLGRWLTTDPIGFSGGSHLSAYVTNQPLTRTDPLGLFPVEPPPPETSCDGTPVDDPSTEVHERNNTGWELVSFQWNYAQLSRTIQTPWYCPNKTEPGCQYRATGTWHCPATGGNAETTASVEIWGGPCVIYG